MAKLIKLKAASSFKLVLKPSLSLILLPDALVVISGGGSQRC